MAKVCWKSFVLLALLVLLVLMVPSATLVAGAEELPCPTYVPVELKHIEPLDFTDGTPYAPHQDCYLENKGGYRDDSINIEITTMRRFDTTIMVMFVQLADASQMRTKLNRPYPSDATSPAASIAKRVNAVAAINGDYFTFVKKGYIVRNGEKLRERYDINYDSLIIDDEGDFHIIRPMTEEAISAYTGTVAQAFAFGPALVMDGEVVTEYPEQNNGKKRNAQRLAIGQIGPLTYVIVATEGPENKGSKGLTMLEIAQVMGELGTPNAYNLDGGCSATVVLNNKKINSLSSGKVRPIADILYFVTGIPEGE